MRRAFLSHSTNDKEFVEQVAERLGHARVGIDTKAFSAGEDFRPEIRRAIDASEVFVFFVSESSLRSVWCAFELNEAELRAMRGQLRRSVAIFIDRPPEPDNLPAWLARLKAVHHTSPDQSARYLAAVLKEPTAEDHPFLGRADDLQRGIRKIAVSDPSPRVLIAAGLEGIGRRSYLRNLFQDALDLALGPLIVLPQTGTLEDLFIESLVSSTMLRRSRLEDQLTIFRRLEPSTKATEVANQLAFLAAEGSAPCIVDQGAMLDGEGTYLIEYEEVLATFLTHDDRYIALVHQRMPQIVDRTIKRLSFSRRLSPLPPPDAKALINRLVRGSTFVATPSQVGQLADAVGGYPPAAYFVVAQAEEYGVDVVLQDNARLREYYTQTFGQYVADLKLSHSEQQLLTYLASEKHLSLEGLVAVLGQPPDQLAGSVRRLVDLNVIEVADGEYYVSEPIRATLLRSGGGLGRRWYETAYTRLEETFWRDEALPPISVVDATLKAGLLVGRRSSVTHESLVRPSLLVSAADAMYHKKDFRLALEYVERAEGMGPNTAPMLDVKIRACAQLGRYKEARHALRELRSLGGRRAWYLDGFINRRERDHTSAIRKFQKGYAAGDRTVALLRDYADSLLRIGAYDDARGIAHEAVERDRSNLFLLDLVARIEIASGDSEAAQAALDALASTDTGQRRVLTRQASFLLLRRGNSEAVRHAIDLSEKAVKRRGAPLEAQLVLARALIAGSKWKRLDQVRDELLKRKDPDMPERLARLDSEEAIKRRDWRRAERILGKAQKAGWHGSVQLELQRLKTEDYSLLPSERAEAEQRMKQLEAQKPVLPAIDAYDDELYE